MPRTSLFKSLMLPMLGICGFGLLSIWALPETIVWRHVLLGLGLILSVLFLRSYRSILLSTNLWPLIMLLGLYLWLLVHLWLFSSQQIEQGEELLSIWARSLAALILGLSIGIFLGITDQKRLQQSHLNKKAVGALFFAGLFSTPLIFIGFYLTECYLANQWIPMAARNWWELPYLQKPPFAVATALLIPLCCAYLLQALRGAVKVWWVFLSLATIFLCISADYLTNTKNGIAMAALTICLFSLYILWQFIFQRPQSLSKSIPLLFLVALLLGGVWWGTMLHLEKNPAWSNLLSNAKLGSDIYHQNYWKNRNLHPTPMNDLGKMVDISTYERTAWFTAGLVLLRERPQGFGLVDHSFGWMARKRWPDFYEPVGNLRGMTHSGWLDLALGIGIPGILLILIPLWVAWIRSLSRNDLWGTYTTLCIPIFFTCYLTTEVTGAHHFIELLMFMVAFFVGVTLIPSDGMQDTRTRQ